MAPGAASGSLEVAITSRSAAELERAEKAAKKKGLTLRERLLLAEEHPGIPDAHILHRLLDRTALLVTNDRPLHNEVLRRGLKSIHVDGEQVTDRALPGIHRKKQYFDAPLKPETAARHQPPQTPIRAALVPEGARQLKRLRTKRRRIRNHLGGMDHLSEVAVSAENKLTDPGEALIPTRGSAAAAGRPAPRPPRRARPASPRPRPTRSAGCATGVRSAASERRWGSA